MKTAPIPSYEYDRICALEDLKILDTATEERFDAITKEATERFAVPISTITLVDKDREWFKSVQGLDDREGPRDISFCGHALISEIVLIVEDTLLEARDTSEFFLKKIRISKSLTTICRQRFMETSSS
jgi:hypothetical protein